MAIFFFLSFFPKQFSTQKPPRGRVLQRGFGRCIRPRKPDRERVSVIS